MVSGANEGDVSKGTSPPDYFVLAAHKNFPSTPYIKIFLPARANGLFWGESNNGKFIVERIGGQYPPFDDH